jgi:hypothetical protein
MGVVSLSIEPIRINDLFIGNLIASGLFIEGSILFFLIKRILPILYFSLLFI